jgi:hypothetical protein
MGRIGCAFRCVIKNTNINLMLALLLLAAPIFLNRAQAQSDLGVSYMRQYIGGKLIHCVKRDGEVISGRYTSILIHFCSSGEFFLFGETERETVLENFERSHWSAQGRWGVARIEGNLVIVVRSGSDNLDVIPVSLSTDGAVQLPRRCQIDGNARCR